MSQSRVVALHPHLAPGLCGRPSCPHVCSRVCHCPAGTRRGEFLLARQAMRRFSVRLDRRRATICKYLTEARLCPSLCREVGGCFLPLVGDHPSEAKRKVFRAQRAVDRLVALRQEGRHGL